MRHFRPTDERLGGVVEPWLSMVSVNPRTSPEPLVGRVNPFGVEPRDPNRVSGLLAAPFGVLPEGQLRFMEPVH